MNSFQAPPISKRAANAYSSSDSDPDSADDNFGHDFGDGGEFQPRKRRRVGGGNAKERAALGVFASDSEDDGPPRAWKGKKLRGKTMAFVSSGFHGIEDGAEEENGAKPRGEGPSEDDEVEDNDNDNDDDDDDNDNDNDNDNDDRNQAKYGMEYVSERIETDESDGDLRGVHITATTSTSVVDTDEVSSPKPTFTSFIPSSAAHPILNERLETPLPRVKKSAQPSAFSAKGQKMSFAARMMAKMGYVDGRGLGKEGQGRTDAIDAMARPSGAGLGAVKEKTDAQRKEEKRMAKQRGEAVEDSEDEHRGSTREKKKEKKNKKKMMQDQDQTMSRSNASAGMPRRQRTRYVTADQLRATAPGLHIPDTFTPILDMTGPDNKLVTSSSGLMTPTTATTAAVELPEITQTRKLAKRAQADLLAFTDEWKFQQERKSYVELELQELRAEADTMQTQVSKLETALGTLGADLQAATTWDATVSCLQRMLTSGASGASEASEASETSKVSEAPAAPGVLREPRQSATIGGRGNDSWFTDVEVFSDLAVAALHPHLKTAEWSPLEEPTRFSDNLKGFSSVILGESKDKNKDRARDRDNDAESIRRRRSSTPYEAMMYTVWLPPVLSAVRSWDVSDPQSMLTLFETWQPILPRFVRAQLLDGIIRHLHAAVTKWRPRGKRRHDGVSGSGSSGGSGRLMATTATTTTTTTMTDDHRLPHLWLFPWLVHLPAHHLSPRGSGLVSEVRRKFRHLVDGWDFTRGLVPGLEDWCDVFGSEHWQALVVGNVLPAMGRALRGGFRVDPADQEPYMALLAGVLRWTRLLGCEPVGEALAQAVFPMWHRRLHEWLRMEGANAEEIAMWFAWWAETVMPVGMRGVKAVEGEFEKGHQTLVEAFSGRV